MTETKFRLSASAQRNRAKMYPRHFIALCNQFCGDDVSFDAGSGRRDAHAPLLMRGPSAYSLGWLSSAAKPGTPNVFQELTEAEIQSIRDGRVLVLDLGWEALFAHEVIVRSLVDATERTGIRPDRIAIIHSNLFAGQTFEH